MKVGGGLEEEEEDVQPDVSHSRSMRHAFRSLARMQESWMVHHGVVFPTVDIAAVGYSRTTPPWRRQAGSQTYASSGQGARLVRRRLTILL